LPPERGATPEERNGRIRGVYPWGYDWPPPNNVDNLADINSARKASLDSAIAGYEDKYPFVAPVAALPLNERGICGLAGNVSEWVDTDYEPAPAAKPGETAKPSLGTTRGGNWRTSAPEELLASARMPVPPETRRNTIGFRVVLVRGK
jgi:formylglycine-generating enzyme required for sulfatase activity